MQNNNSVCRFCLKLVHHENMELINPVTRKMLAVLLINLDLDVTEDPLACKMCFGILNEIYMFKSKCLYSEDIVNAHFERNLKVSLRDILIELENEHNVNNAENEVVCRLCIKVPRNGGYVVLDETSEVASHCRDIVQVHLPEINLNITTETPIICEPCRVVLKKYLSFATNCMDVEQKIKMYREYQRSSVKEEVDLLRVLQFTENKKGCENSLNGDFALKQEDSSIHVKIEEVEKDNVFKDHFTNSSNTELYIKEEEVDIKAEDDQTSCDQCNYSTHATECLVSHKRMHRTSPTGTLQCNQCDYRTKNRTTMRLHQRAHDPTTHRFKCEQCEFTSYYQSLIKKHLLTHMKLEETVAYCCATCDFKTKYKQSFTNHMKRCLKKKNNTDSKIILQCNQCDFRSKSKNSFRKHKAKHDPSRNKYKCKHCKYCTFDRSRFSRHLLTHVELGEAVLYSCATCRYKTKYKNNLMYHMKSCSKDTDDINSNGVFQCNQCDFRTKLISYLAKHKKKHDSTNCKFKCEQCEYCTHRRSRLTQHLITHMEAGEIEVYFCATCDFKSKYKSSLGDHMKRCPMEKNGTDSRVLLRCNRCDFHTKSTTSLFNHKKRHDPTKYKFKCEQCGYATCVRANLNRHMITHMEPREVVLYHCETCQQFKTKYKGNLTEHTKKCKIA